MPGRLFANVNTCPSCHGCARPERPGHVDSCRLQAALGGEESGEPGPEVYSSSSLKPVGLRQKLLAMLGTHQRMYQGRKEKKKEKKEERKKERRSDVCDKKRRN